MRIPYIMYKISFSPKHIRINIENSICNFIPILSRYTIKRQIKGIVGESDLFNKQRVDNDTHIFPRSAKFKPKTRDVHKYIVRNV